MAAKKKKSADTKKPASTKKPRAAKVPDASDYLAELLKLRGKNEPEDFAFFNEALYGEAVERMGTGLLGLDKLIGGGWPVGRMIEIAGWEGAGKSTLLDQSIAQWQRSGGIAHLIDNGEGRDIKYTKSLGVNVNKLITSEVEMVEEAFLAIDKILAIQIKHFVELEKAKQKPPPLLIAWDSLGGTLAKEEFEGDADDAHVAVAARIINLNFKRILSKLAHYRVTLIFTNHFYKTIPGGYLVSYGGKGPRYYPSIRLWLRKMDGINISTVQQGSEVEAKLKKTKIGRPKPPEVLGMIHNAGFDNSWTLFNWGKTHGIGGDYPDHRWVKQAGPWCYLLPPGYETITFQKSFRGLGEILSDNPEIYKTMVAAYLADENA